MELNIATLNVRGLQSKGSWRTFLKQVITWARRHRVNALCIQEHNLQKSRDSQLKYDAHEVGWNLVIGYAAARSARGGCAILLLKEIEVEIKKSMRYRRT
jgi:exonuclease III